MAWRIITHRLDRVPSVMPARRPAVDRSWQGEPPSKRSILPAHGDQSMWLISPRFGTPGNRWARILHGPVSMSETNAVSAPNTSSTARVKPP